MHRLNEQDISQLHQSLNSLFDQNLVAIAVLRGQTYVIEQANTLVCEIWGRTQKQVLGLPLFKALPEVRGQGLEELLQGVLTTGESYIGKELPIKLKRSEKLETVYFDFIYVPMRDEKTGEITGITVMATDVTKQMLTTRRLSESEKRYRTLIEQSPLSIQILSPDGMTRQVNKAWETLWGANLDLLKDYNMLNDEQLVKLGIMPYIKKGFEGTPTFIPPVRYEPQKTLPDVTEVTYRWVQAYIYPVKDENDVIQEVVLIHQDITEQKNSEEKAARLAVERAELLVLNQAKDEFIALASHQLRTPATAVKQFLGIALDGYVGELPSEPKKIISQAYTSNERQLNVIEDLLKVAQIDSGIVQLKKSKVLFLPLIQDVVDGYKDAFKSRKQSVVIDSTSKSISGKADPDKIRMVLENIIDNASKYTPDGKKITIRISKVRDKIQVSIRDQGVGIAPESMDKLFQKFSRIDNPLSINVGGTGLGLYWAKKIIELHGGNIEVTSSPDRGSTFKILLPVQS